MRPPRRAGPPRNLPLGTLGLAAVGVALLLIGAARLLGAARGAERNLAALVVTPAPAPARPAALISLPTVAAAPGPDAPPAPATILLLGSDRRPGEEATPRSDAMLLLRVEPARRRVALLSLPRDLWASIPGHGQSRINAAYLWGERDGPPGAGMALASATVGDLLGLQVDYVAVVDFRGFIGLIDALGGIAVDVERPLVDTRFPTASRRYTTVRFAAGPQPMDGATALTYCRIRHPDDDFARHRRQQAVLLAIAARLRERGDLGNLLDAERISAALVGYLRTDMPKERMIDLAMALRGLDLAAVERYSMGEADVSFGVANDRYAQQARPGAIDRLARQLLGADR